MITGWICSEKARAQSKTIESPVAVGKSEVGCSWLGQFHHSLIFIPDTPIAQDRRFQNLSVYRICWRIYSQGQFVSKIIGIAEIVRLSLIACSVAVTMQYSECECCTKCKKPVCEGWQWGATRTAAQHTASFAGRRRGDRCGRVSRKTYGQNKRAMLVLMIELAMCGTVIKILFFRNMCYNIICMCGDCLSAHRFQSV